MGIVNKLISQIQGGAPPLTPRTYTSNRVWPKPSVRSHSPIVRRGIRWGSTPSIFWLDWQHIRGAFCGRCPPPGLGVGVIRFPHAWDDPQLGACAHDRAVTYLQMSRREVTVAPRQPHTASRATPSPWRITRGPTAEGGHASCQAQLGENSNPQLASTQTRIRQGSSRWSVTHPLVARESSSSARQIKVG